MIIVLFVLGLVMLVLSAASIWYLFQTVRIMWGFNFFIAIVAVFLNPLVHIVFYFFPKDGFDSHKKRLFKNYFFSLLAIVVIGATASILIPALESRKGSDNMYDDKREPWEWDIRSERFE